MAGSVARTIGPIVVAVMFENYGPEITWVLPIIMLAVTVLLWIICWKKIVPLDSNPKLKPGESHKYDNGNK
uniref:Major facilitator superfamily (MFS) profile domain-containing protein n=1 Tax=Acrobeloides nanus TaxID=290746 RepID=A0A914CFI9_9BILA